MNSYAANKTTSDYLHRTGGGRSGHAGTRCNHCVYTPMDGTGTVRRLLCGRGQGVLSRGRRESEDRASLSHAARHEPAPDKCISGHDAATLSGRYFSAYTKHDGDSIRTIQGGSDKYQYFFMDWYLMPMLLDKPCWTEPYMDYDVATNTSEMVTSFCQTIKDHHGQKIGVINTSLSISWLSQTISATKPYPNSYSIMIGRGGTYFVHPDTTKITRQTIYTQTIEKPDTALEALGHAMQRGEEGMKHMIIDGEDCYVFYKPLGQTGCSMAIVCTEKDVFSSFNRLRQSVMAMQPLYGCEGKDIIIDCAGLEYISSAGLRIFLGILQNAEEKGGHVYIKGITDNVRAIFTLTGFSNIFQFK